jgi:diguanylate cyclase (GGDEF)-like protein/PAS domain S-box-containing protein
MDMPERLLIAEDSRTQREVLRTQLLDAGYDVVSAADGEEALDLLRQGPVHMLISDVVMPGMDGYELCRLAKAHDRRLPVVLLTSMTDPLDVVHGLQAGADNFLRKPYEFTQLLSRIRMMLHNKQLRDAGQTQMGLELFFLNRRFMITAERQQILDLLVSTFEDLVGSNLQLRQQEAALAAARDALGAQLVETQAQHGRLATVLCSVPQAMAVVDDEGVITAASDALAELVGATSSAELEGRPASECLRLLHHDGTEFACEERPLSLALSTGQEVHAGRAFDVLAQRGDGNCVPVLLHAAPVFDAAGRTTGAVGVAHELEAFSRHDPLTHLPGHTAFAQHVDAAVQALAHTHEVVAVLVLVLDRSRDLRDSLGKDGSDRLLSALAQRLQEALALPLVVQHTREPAAGYLGDTEFAIVLPGLADEAQGVLVAETIRTHVSGVHRVEDLEVNVTLAAGFSATTAVGTRAEDLVPAAAAAAHAASRRGGDRLDSSSRNAVEGAADRLRQEADLRRGIDHGELRVHYQPIMSLHDGVAGVEALVRWEHPERGFQSPADFIPLAEDSGLVVPLGWEVLRQACEQMARWHQELPGGDALTVSVNLSPQQLVQESMAERVAAVLSESGLPAAALSLEVTETGMVTDTAVASDQLHQLRAMGVHIALDDFGTGYSSLLQLRTLPMDTLKVDRQFVDGLMTDPDDAVIVSASISLALALRLQVVAEGVETLEQADELRRLGCEFGQGFLWSRPLAPGDFEKWWEERPTCAAAPDHPPG